MHVVIFTDTLARAHVLSDKLYGRINKRMKIVPKHNWTVLDIIDSRNIRIDIRMADRIKSAGLRPSHVLFYNAPHDFINYWRYNMGGRYTELETLDDVVQLIVREEDS